MHNLNTLQKMAQVFMALAESKPLSAGFLFYCPDDKTILLVKRSKKMNNPNVWGIPGGRPDEDDEPPLETAEREVKEELSKLPKDKKLLKTHLVKRNKTDFKVYVYEITAKEKKRWTPKIDLDKENSKYKWFELNDLPKEKDWHFDLSWISEILT